MAPSPSRPLQWRVEPIRQRLKAAMDNLPAYTSPLFDSSQSVPAIIQHLSDVKYTIVEQSARLSHLRSEVSDIDKSWLAVLSTVIDKNDEAILAAEKVHYDKFALARPPDTLCCVIKQQMQCRT